MVTDGENKYMLEQWNLSNMLTSKTTELEIPYSDNSSVNLHSTSDYVAIVIKKEIIVYELVAGRKIMHVKYMKNIIGITNFNESFLIIADDGTFYEIDKNFKDIKLRFMISPLFERPMTKFVNVTNNMELTSTMNKKYLSNSNKLIACQFQNIILITEIKNTTFYIIDYIKVPLIISNEDDSTIKDINMVFNCDYTLLLVHYYKNNLVIINNLKPKDEISFKNKVCNSQTHVIQFNKKEKIVDFMFDDDYLYSITENGVITEWKLLKNGRKYRRKKFLTSLRNCKKFLNINKRKFIIHTALKISFIAINEVDQSF
uniref:CNH domain-containing protein n=1 Tax=Parastrongyloides trichosuri TaxID=131310 RepID=A0A0N5A0J0_PARTI